MKKRHHSKRKQTKRKQTRKKNRAKARRTARPREVWLALRRLLDTANHIQARAAGLENALGALREQERCAALKELLLALRNSPDGNLLRCQPDQPGDGPDRAAPAIVRALVEAFSITPIHKIGEQIPVKGGDIPDSLELDRSLGDEPEACVAAEVISVGWRYRAQTLLKPVVRPLFRSSQPEVVAYGVRLNIEHRTPIDCEQASNFEQKGTK